MNLKEYHVIGVMSGTSRDGIDLAYIQFCINDKQWSYRFLTVDTLAYTAWWEKTLEEADGFPPSQIEQLNEAYTTYLAAQIQVFIDQNKIKKIDAVCSHGHTIFHQPERKYTLQIGNLPQIATLLQLPVVCDFRTRDVLLGGQGAPLVPIGDRLLFSSYDFCINLGGFANISVEQNQKRVAYDICAVNTVLNRYAEKLGKAYDDKGRIAQKGQINTSLLNRLNSLPFYQSPPPKSLGIEWVKGVLLPLLEKAEDTPENILATYTRHIAVQLAAALPGSASTKTLITGGGAFNDYLIHTLKELTPSQLIIPDPELINYKEALIFGLLGVLRLRGEVNVLSSVTGAPEDHSAGEIYYP